MSAVNGMHSGTNHAGPQEYQVPPEIAQALELVHDPRTANDQRQEAFRYLEHVKESDDAPYKGYVLSIRKSNASTVRHYGLSLLETAIRLRWQNWQEPETHAVRQWVLQLAQDVDESDPLFIRNKVAQLWVEVAKRSWALDWLNMDEMLVELWSGSAVRKVLVLEVLETLSENSFGKEDTTTALRGQDLSKACVEIFTPESVLINHFPGRDTTLNVRHGSEGWLSRISEFLAWCNTQDSDNQVVELCILKSLSTLKSVLGWAIFVGIADATCVERICQVLVSKKSSVQLAFVETLYALYSRHNYSGDDIKLLVSPLYESNTIDVLRRLYTWSVVKVDDLDDERYLLCKKLSELIHTVGKFLHQKPDALSNNADIPNFFTLLLEIVRNESLHVSIPVLHLWSQLLQSSTIGHSQHITPMIEPLLELCSQRLIRYEALSEDSDLPALIFLREDLDTIPERHAFLGNYARFCKDVIDAVVLKQPLGALQYILSQTDLVLQHLYDGQPAFDVQNYKKASPPALKLDTQVSVIEAALVGYTHWRSEKYKLREAAAFVPQQENINSALEQWCRRLFGVKFEDPGIQQRLIVLVADFALDPLKRNVDFIRSVFRYLLDTKAVLLANRTVSNVPQYNEDVKELHRLTSHQIQRIALRAADYLIDSFPEIESALSSLCQMPQIEEEDRDRCISALFIIVQRAGKLRPEERAAQLESYVSSAMSKWSDPQLGNALQSWDGFCNLLHFAGFEDYFIQQQASQIEDWSTVELTEEGKALKARIDAAHHELPLRATSTFFSVSLDKTEPGSDAFTAALVLWSRHLPNILGNVLQLISLSHMFSEPATWSDSSAEMQTILNRILRDRFWQVGISSGSRDEFYTRVEKSKSSLEGLASAIRGSLRYDGLAPVMAKAIFERSNALSTHQSGILIDMMRPIIEHCPPDARGQFLTPVLTAMFDSLDKKISTEWSVIEASKAASGNNDLQEEMKNESILRQLTYNCVMLVVRLLDPNEAHPPNSPTLRDFVLGTPEVFKSVILFCTHALQMHDGRCCGLITRVLRSIVGVFTGTDQIANDIREFISTDVFKACIVSLHDPYFVDIQSDLAQLIASIIKRYNNLTQTPHQILLSLPGMDPAQVEAALSRIYKTDSASRIQRAVVLKLLENLRGVSVSEQGRLPKPDPKKARSALQEKYTTVEAQPKSIIERERSPDLGGVADMFA